LEKGASVPFFCIQIIFIFDKTLIMKGDKYWASNPKKNGSYLGQGRVEGRPASTNSLKEDMSCACKPGFKLMYKNTKDKKYCD
jgi:hypothetical protein